MAGGLALPMVLLLAACAAFEPAPPAPAKTVAPMDGFGRSTLEITAGDEQARAWFAQGLLLAYAFEHREAARVFRAAAARDPRCAMCAWGLAYSLGPNINNPDRGPAREIRAAIAQARAAAAGATPMERALIEAMAARHGSADPRQQASFEALGAAMCGTRKAAEKAPDPHDLAYVAAMADVLRQYPDQPDIVTLYADAVMNPTRWEWWDAKTGQPNGRTADALAQLRAVVARHPQHTGASHFLVHIAEHSPQPREAEAAADALGQVAPSSPHLVHMGSHVYKNLGRFADGTRANEQALAVQKTFDAALKAQGVVASGYWDQHHLHFLWYSALMEGRTALSLRTARDYARRFGGWGDGMGEYARMLPMVTLVRLQQWDAVLAEPDPQPGLGLQEAYTLHARGLAFLYTGRMAQARQALAQMAPVMRQSTLARAQIWGDPVPKQMAEVAQAVLSAAIARAEGRAEAAVALLRSAADLDDGFGSDPPALGAGARLSLAGALIDAGRADEAGQALAEVLRLYGPSAWTHQGAAQLARLRGVPAESAQHADRARAAWQAAERAPLPVL